MAPDSFSSIPYDRQAASRLLERVRRSISEFLAIPILIVAAFFALALVLYVMDNDAGASAHWGPVRTFLGRYVGDGEASTSLLTTIAGSLITVTSITFSILLLAVQQGASALTSQIIDHYLRRASNRVYFGFFVGTSVFALVTLVLTTAHSHPVLGATFATIFAGMALFALILLIYSTIDQIRPVSIINSIHDAALSVRVTQAKWLGKTAPIPVDSSPGQPLLSDCNGYLARVRVTSLQQLIAARPGCTITLRLSVGDYVARGGEIASVAHATLDDAFGRELRRALPIEEQRDVDCDASFSVDHLINIAWTTISTAKSNPAVGVAACHALQDILFRWAGDRGGASQAAAGAIRYHDRVMEHLLDGFETLVVVASESMQHQSLVVAMDAMSATFDRLPATERDRIEDILLCSLPALGDHLPTRMLEQSFVRAIATLRDAGRMDAADRLEAGWTTLAATRGVIKSRGNRA